MSPAVSPSCVSKSRSRKLTPTVRVVFYILPHHFHLLTKLSYIVFLGYVGWAAGNFYAGSYVLGETPTEVGTTWTDTLLVSSCMAPK